MTSAQGSVCSLRQPKGKHTTPWHPPRRLRTHSLAHVQLSQSSAPSPRGGHWQTRQQLCSGPPAPCTPPPRPGLPRGGTSIATLFPQGNKGHSHP